MFMIQYDEHACRNFVNRRQFVRSGVLGSLLPLLELWSGRRALAAEGKPTGAASDVSLILVSLYGGISHIDTFDPKPDAPAEIRGPIEAINTRLPGIQLSEYLPRLASIADKFSIVRSVIGAGALHSTSQYMSGWAEVQNKPVQRPGIGSVISKVLGWSPSGVPPFVYLGSGRVDDGLLPWYLGPRHKPVVCSGTELSRSVAEFELGEGVSFARLEERRRLLDSIDRLRDEVEAIGELEEIGMFRQRAFDLLASTRFRGALDLTQENEGVVRRYGKSKELLVALRLVEAGVRCITVDVAPSPGWDTHRKNFMILKRLVGHLDGPLAALIEDLHERGLEKKVLILVCSEFGRTPRINDDDGRDHWPNVMSWVLAGGGLRHGQVIGTTDRWAAEATSSPYSLQNVLATAYTVLGIDPATQFMDQSGRPVPLLEDVRLVTELI